MTESIFFKPTKLIKKQFSLQSFEKFILNSHNNIQQLSRIIKNCKADQLQCRFNIWRLCLGVITNNSTVQEKKEEITNSRNRYIEKKQQALKLINKKSPVRQKKNPLLMLGAKTENKQTESDEFLKEQIQKDVDRTYQEMPFFQNQQVLKLLSRVLFVWCKRNPQVSYKQGMNELLASVVVCYFQEAQFKSEQQAPEEVSPQLWQTHLHFNSVKYAQQDIYSVFQKIINIQGDMYKTQADQCIKNKVNPNSKNNTPILQRIIQIKDHKLKHMDLELFRIIKLQDVQTKSFMLRWIRCMHTREFSLENSFVIWDSIFLEYWESPLSKKKGQFEFLDAMCLAMFIYMRSIVFTKETAGQILQVYQKYPPLKKGQYLDELITLAWTVCEQLRLQNQNASQIQTQVNWFEESDKIKNLGFMQFNKDKKSQTDQKKQQLTKKSEPTITQLKQTHQNKKTQTQKPVSLPQKQKPAHFKSQSPQKAPQIIKIHSQGQKPEGKKQIIEQKFTVGFESNQVEEMITNLQEALKEIRDIDVQSNIRKTIKKLEGGIKKARKLE